MLALIDALLAFEVDFAVVGSVATRLHGVELVPGDLDVVLRVAAQATART